MFPMGNEMKNIIWNQDFLYTTEFFS